MLCCVVLWMDYLPYAHLIPSHLIKTTTTTINHGTARHPIRSDQTLAVFLLKRHMFRWASLLFYLLAHLAGALIGSCLLILLPLAREGGGGYPPVVGVLQEEVTLDARGATLLLVLSTAYLATFVANTDAEYDEGFLHPAMMVGLTYAGLLAAMVAGNNSNNDASGGTILQTGLFNPAVTLVLWSISRASTGVVLLGTVGRCVE